MRRGTRKALRARHAEQEAAREASRRWQVGLQHLEQTLVPVVEVLLRDLSVSVWVHSLHNVLLDLVPVDLNVALGLSHLRDHKERADGHGRHLADLLEGVARAEAETAGQRDLAAAAHHLVDELIDLVLDGAAAVRLVGVVRRLARAAGAVLGDSSIQLLAQRGFTRKQRDTSGEERAGREQVRGVVRVEARWLQRQRVHAARRDWQVAREAARRRRADEEELRTRVDRHGFERVGECREGRTAAQRQQAASAKATLTGACV